ncbi:MAG: hypothetical protein JXA07_10825 [Spirochaetes bacterium]|nr:hypothetical protein [Spirochaetota bacterium]
MHREIAAHNEIHVSHFMSKPFSVRREERIWSPLNDLNLTSRIEMRNNNAKGVQ